MRDRHTAHRAVYDAIAPVYDTRQRPALSPFLQESFNRLCALTPAGRLVADVGCGPGQDLARLAAQGFAVVGVDLSEEMLARAAARAPGRLVVGDLRRLPLATGSCAGVWSSYALLHLDDSELRQALNEVARLLAPGGICVLVLAGRGSGRETVSYVPEHSREFFAHRPNRVSGLARAAGLEVLSCDDEPDGWRAPVRLVATRSRG